ncbi:SCO family protein [Streptomyces alkaliterrae]|uniref:SCO family protein n=1 Tax=Streptomyces alkaliterrae TaxID=2213162 RepID=A0A5P0YQD3_9ACTN|nr:SCO family protein [Streptomyces alkaliterrae]MBB1253399.1 SCO family protein [Streptomyces alkaliterrae]MBB1260016.1 SCO family protein [Streptomyces alkaliterrae]MQS02120.1 SCO family protein [Streptomyces alkaliterrae]
MRPTTASTRRAGLALALAAALAVGATACGSGTGAKSADSPAAEVSDGSSGKQGVVLDRPFEKPDMILTDTDGEEFDLIEETKGKPTLIYFGYTNCPDVCPLTMSNIAFAKSQLPEADQDKLQVVFVTSDPERDTPKELGKWLKSAAPGSIGLTGDFDTIQAGARSVGVAIEPSYEEKNGDIVSTHGSQVLFFSPKDDRAHVLYTEGVTAETFEKDFPKLIKGENP